MNGDTAFKIKKNVAFRHIGDQVVIVDAETNRMMMFNGTASDIWQKLEQHRTVNEIVASLVDSWDVAETNADSDVKTFIETLLKKNLVEITS